MLATLAQGDSLPAASTVRSDAAQRARAVAATLGHVKDVDKETENAAKVMLAFESPADALRERLLGLTRLADLGQPAPSLTERARSLLRGTPLATLHALDRPHAASFDLWMALGETPLANLSLPVGTHELEARPSEGDGPVRRQRVTVVEGETARVLFR